MLGPVGGKGRGVGREGRLRTYQLRHVNPRLTSANPNKPILPYHPTPSATPQRYARHAPRGRVVHLRQVGPGGLLPGVHRCVLCVGVVPLIFYLLTPPQHTLTTHTRLLPPQARSCATCPSEPCSCPRTRSSRRPTLGGSPPTRKVQWKGWGLVGVYMSSLLLRSFLLSSLSPSLTLYSSPHIPLCPFTPIQAWYAPSGPWKIWA